MPTFVLRGSVDYAAQSKAQKSLKTRSNRRLARDKRLRLEKQLGEASASRGPFQNSALVSLLGAEFPICQALLSYEVIASQLSTSTYEDVISLYS